MSLPPEQEYYGWTTLVLILYHKIKIYNILHPDLYKFLPNGFYFLNLLCNNKLPNKMEMYSI